MSKKNPMGTDANAAQCHGEVTSDISAITAAANIGKNYFSFLNGPFRDLNFICYAYTTCLIFHFTAGCSVEIASMLQRLNSEKRQKDEEIKRLTEINELQGMVGGSIKTGTVY